MKPPTEPLVSIIIPNYNGQHYLPECLDSLLEQSYANLEIIVVDNASTDASVELVERDYESVRLIKIDANRGFSAAVNSGLRASSGHIIVLLNNDTRADRDFVRVLYEGMSASPDAAMAAPKMLFARDPEIINSLGLGYNITGTNHDIGFGLRDNSDASGIDWIFGPCGGAGMYRRSLFDDIGCFDEDFFMYYEDVDISLRAQLAGHKCVSVPAARVYHAEGASGATLPRRRDFYFARNSLSVILKDFPGRLIYRNFHAIFWEISKRIGSALIRGDFSTLMGYLAAMGHSVPIMRKRREVQKRKRVPDGYIEDMLRKNRGVVKQINLKGRPAGRLG